VEVIRGRRLEKTEELFGEDGLGFEKPQDALDAAHLRRGRVAKTEDDRRELSAAERDRDPRARRDRGGERTRREISERATQRDRDGDLHVACTGIGRLLEEALGRGAHRGSSGSTAPGPSD
jgi:hypothetical protein